ncbi:MAG TPA: biotin/lipoate A/B protein ligase family protein [Candidatus Sulfotelmatobacter sp.]|nr:biotin/lipoate A/B protein ligase family protein [Candidatus Sulfotelmatobacter sp.]
MQTWRLLKLETQNAAMNMAIDEAILTARTINRVPNTFRLYQWKPSTVSIGRNQKVENEVQLNNCHTLGVDVIRRISGGGTVYHDEKGEVTYSLITNTNDLGVRNIMDVYRTIYEGIRDSLRILGLTADFNEGDAKNCPNLTVNGKKISGSSQANKRETVLQHGTLLLDVDLEKMFTLLHVPWANSCMEVVNVAKNKITSIKDELHHSVHPETVANALTKGFQNTLHIQMLEDALSSFELDLAKKLYSDKYATNDWNLYGKSILG